MRLIAIRKDTTRRNRLLSYIVSRLRTVQFHTYAPLAFAYQLSKNFIRSAARLAGLPQPLLFKMPVTNKVILWARPRRLSGCQAVPRHSVARGAAATTRGLPTADID